MLCRKRAPGAGVLLLVRLLALAVAGASVAGATVLTSVFDTNVESGVGSVIGLGAIGSDLYVFATQTYYLSPLYNGSLSLSPSAVGFPTLGVRLSVLSFATPDPADSNHVILSGGTLIPTIYDFRLTPPAESSVALGATIRPTGLLLDSTGAEYLTRSRSTAGILKYASPSDTTPELQFGATGPGALTTPTVLAMGPDGLIYVLDTGADDIESFDTAGNFVNEFPLVDTPDSTALTVGSNGWLYTANGDGSGDIYDIYTGTHAGTFGLPALNPTYDTTTFGHSVLLANGNSLYEFVPNLTGLPDPNAGIHVFEIPTPEPATWTMLLLSTAGFGWMRRAARCRAGGESGVSDQRS
jgi:hypothetical protein